MELTKDNYFSLDAQRHYMSVSQFKSFVPAFGGCEAAAMAQLRGDYVPEEKEAYKEGHFVHAWNEGTLDEFKANNPTIYSSQGPTKGQLKSTFKHCTLMIEVLENDPMVMQVLAGRKEVILTAELHGIPWKIMLDSYQPMIGVFTDLKALKDLEGKFWNKEAQIYENFLEHYGYLLQMAVYAEVEKRAKRRKEWLLPHMVVVTKQDPPDHDIMYFDFNTIQAQLNTVEKHIERVKAVKRGVLEPDRCEKCDYCRVTKKIVRIKDYKEFSLY